MFLVRAAMATAAAGALTGARAAGAPSARAAATPGFDALWPVFGDRHAVTWDQYSLLVDGQRVPIWSAEVHPYWRLPSPGLWRDLLETVRAAGFNAISTYFHWGLHSPAPGTYDFSGVRDVDLLLSIAEQAGLYVIARPGPYIMAETDGGGLPAWLPRLGAGRGSPGTKAWLSAVDEWMGQITPILARHQITRGGSIIGVQVENEYKGSGAAATAYIQHLVSLVHQLGINVPLTWNEGSGYTDIIQLGGSDQYPHTAQLLTGAHDTAVTGAVPPLSQTQSPAMVAPSASRRRADAPVMTPEFEGGSLAFWGSPGYDAAYRLVDVPVQRMMDETLLSLTETITNHYMSYGGTNWGWLAMPSTITSYDYGSAIDEARQLTPKAYYHKQIGYRQRCFPQAAAMSANGAPGGSNPDLLFAQTVNPQTKAQWIFVRHKEAEETASDGTTLSLTLPDGTYATVPQKSGTQIQIQGVDAKMLLAAADVRSQRLVYSTSEPFLAATIAGRDFVAFVGRQGEDGETVFRYATQPKVTVLDGAVQPTWTASPGDLRLNYVHGGIQRVLVEGGGRPSMLLLLADDDGAASMWLQSLGDSAALVIGPYLLKSAARDGGTLALTGKTSARLPQVGDVGGATSTAAWAGEVSQPAAPTELVVYADNVHALSWNGHRVSISAQPQPDGALSGVLAGPPAIALPTLTGWRFRSEAPEADPGFDDSAWKTIPAAGPLDADTYGFHHGNVWYRGTFTATGSETAVKIQTVTGGAPGGFMAWLNGQFLGCSTDAQTSTYYSSDPSIGTFPIEQALNAGGQNTLCILTEGAHAPQDLGVIAGQAGGSIGLYSVQFAGGSPTVAWKIQGLAGGEQPADPVRGAFNNGGLYGEREGWHLPDYDDAGWEPVSLPDAWATRGVAPGVAWYRTRFDLRLPHDTDVPLGVRIDDVAAKSYEALIFVNGWMIGRYANALGPQHLFTAPQGILNHRGVNTLAIAVLSRNPHGATTTGLGTVALQAYGRYRGAAFNAADADAAFA